MNEYFSLILVWNVVRPLIVRCSMPSDWNEINIENAEMDIIYNMEK